MNQTTAQPTTIKRGQFLREMGLSGAALMAFYCLGTTSCTSDKADPTPTPTPTPGTGVTPTTGLTGNAEAAKGAISFGLDLTNADYSKLKTEGGYVVVGDVLVAFVKDKKYVAVSKTCTHAGTTLQYRLAENDIWCSNHGSEFGLDGKVESGPAPKAITAFKTEISTDGNKLTIKE